MEKVNTGKRVMSLIMLIIMMFTLVPSETFAQTGFTITNSTNDLGVNYANIYPRIGTGSATFSSTNSALKVDHNNFVFYDTSSNTERQYDTTLYYEGKLNWGTANRTSTSDAVLGVTTVPGTATFRMTNGASLADGTKADILITFKDIKIAVGAIPEGANPNATVKVPLAFSSLETSIMMHVATHPRTGNARTTVLQTSFGVEETVTITLVKTGTNTPIDESQYPTVLFAMRDLDIPDYTMASGNTPAQNCAGRYAESCALVSGFQNKLYKTAGTQTVNDTMDGSTRIRGLAGDDDDMTMDTGFIATASTQGFTYTWRASRPATGHDGAMTGTTFNYLPNVSVKATAGTGGTIEKAGEKSYIINSKTLYKYTPSEGYKVKSLKVNGSTVSFTKSGGTYTFNKLIETNPSGVDHTIDVEFEHKDYLVQYKAGTGGSITGKTSEYKDPNEVTTGTSWTPNTGYVTTGWTCNKAVTLTDGTTIAAGSNITTAQTKMIKVNDNITLTVNFRLIKYNITTQATNGTIDASTTADHGTNKTINYSPNAGYELKSVTVDGSSVSITTYPNKYTFSNITADHDIKVVYEKIKYNITTQATNGTITENATVEYGGSKTITYSPNTGYKLKSVTVDGTAVNINTYPNSYTFSNVTANHDIKVVYEKIKYNITTQATNGTIDANATVEYGASKTINYAPNTGYKLKSVAVDGTAVNISQYPSSYSFSNVTSNHDIKVVYEKIKYNIATQATNGTITPTATVEYGDNKTISYQPNEGYKLKSVTVDGSAIDITQYPSSYTFSNVKANHDIKVVYEIKKFNIVTSVENGTIDPNVTKNYGTNETIHYAPTSDQYKLKSVTVDGNAVDITRYPTEYPFNNIKANHTIDVKYVRKDYTVTYASDEGGQITGKVEEWRDPNENPTGTTQRDKDMYRFSHYEADVPVTLTDGTVISAGDPITPDQIPEVVVNSHINFTAIHDKLFNVNYISTEGGVITGKTHEIRSEKENPTGSAAEPNEGYQFRFWTDEDGNIVTMDEIERVTLDRDRTFTAVFEKIPNVETEKLADKESYNVDEDIVYTINVRQTVDGAIARGVAISDSLPEGVSIVSDIEITGIDAEAVINGNAFTVYFDELADEEVTITFIAHADKKIVMTPELLNTVQIDVPNGDNPEDPSVTVGRTVKVDTLILNGEITPSEKDIPVGSDRNIAFTPNEGYMITHIYVNGVEESPEDYPESFPFTNLVDNNDIYVVCERIPYEIDTEVVNGTISGGGTAYWGDDREVTYSPNEGCQLLYVEVDGERVGGFDASYIFENVRENHSIKVVYERIPELKVEKTSDRANYNVGDEITYEVTITQTVNGAEARDILITDVLGEGAEYVEGSLEGLDVVSESKFGYTAKIDSLTDSVTYAYKTIATEEKEDIVNTVVAVSPNTPDEGRGETSVNAYVPVASVNKTVDKEEALYGDILTYTITIRNEKAGSELRNVIVKDMMPEGLELIPESVEVEGGDSFPGEYVAYQNLGDNAINMTVGNIEETPIVITFNAKIVGKEGSLLNTAEVTSNAEPVSDSVSTEIISPVLSVVKAVSKPEAIMGETVTYVIKVKSDITPSINAIITDEIPEGLELEERSIKIEGASGEVTFKDGVLTATFPEVTEATILYRAKVTMNGAEIKNIATFTSENNPGNPVNDNEDLLVNRVYKATFVDGQGNTIKVEENIPLHGSATEPEAPERKGYRFTGWDIEFDDVTEDLIVTALWEPLYTVTFVDGFGETLKVEEDIQMHGKGNAPAEPKKDGFAFKGWDVSFDDITENLTVTAIWEPLYTVTFMDGFGETLKVQEDVPMHGKGEAPKSPKKDEYVFKGWDVTFDDITGDLTVTALWEKVNDSPKTGDDNSILLYAGLMLASTLSAISLKRRRTN